MAKDNGESVMNKLYEFANKLGWSIAELDTDFEITSMVPIYEVINKELKVMELTVSFKRRKEEESEDW